MADKPGLLYWPNRDNFSVVLSGVRSSLIARARRDAAKLTPNSKLLAADGSAKEASITHEASAEAQFNLGLRFCYGKGIPQDYTQAEIWFRKAADQGDARAQRFLGSLYANGLGIPQDDMAAAVWLRKAADQGDVWAQLDLGLLYSTGAGVPRDDAQAAMWIGRAAEHGMPSALHAFGLLHKHGRGIPQNDADAYFWLYLSTKTTWINREYAEARDSAAAKLTDYEIAELKKRADHWLAINPHIKKLF